VGMGGPLMAGEGVELLAELDDLAVMGFAEVLGRLPFFLRLERRVTALLDSGRVDLVLPIDYPGFNLRMTRAAHRRGIPVLYYITPQVWAWKPRRAARLAREAAALAVIFPFEVEFLARYGARATFVGHPLLEEDEAPTPAGPGAFAAREGLDPERPILALLPGSRRQELDRHLALFAEVARRVVAARPGVQPVLAQAPSLPGAALEGVGLPVVSDFRGLLHAARAGIVKSGTSTLEAALAEIPFVMVYRTSPFTYSLARRLVKVEHVALANLVAGRRVVPEFLQDQATPERLCAALLPLLDDTPEREAMIVGLREIRSALGTPGASHRVAEMAAALLLGRREGDREGGEM